MSDPIIVADHICKKYVIGENLHGRGARTFRDVFDHKIKKLLHPDKNRQKAATDFWALTDVSFQVQSGEVLGIIGRNGAGKSTLLKILSRITEPTAGKVTLHGRVGSLLEVGTGFSMELTGRENIYLNGAILGMRKAEIDKKFDEIVDFAEIEKFLDTPVKYYSSGMYVRLAFSVAAHLEPDILIVDEVLAVGDAQFQKKCLGKMKNVSTDENRTVLFVSHNMNAVEQLCNSCLLLNAGRIVDYAEDPRKITQKYLNLNKSSTVNIEWENSGHEFANPIFTSLKMYLTDKNGTKLKDAIANDMEAWLSIEGETHAQNENLSLAYAIYNSDDLMVYQTTTHDLMPSVVRKLQHGKVTLKASIPSRLLNEGDYRLELAVFIHGQYFISEFRKRCPTIYFSIHGGLSDSPHWIEKREGVLAPVIRWQVIAN